MHDLLQGVKAGFERPPLVVRVRLDTPLRAVVDRAVRRRLRRNPAAGIRMGGRPSIERDAPTPEPYEQVQRPLRIRSHDEQAEGLLTQLAEQLVEGDVVGARLTCELFRAAGAEDRSVLLLVARALAVHTRVIYAGVDEPERRIAMRVTAARSARELAATLR